MNALEGVSLGVYPGGVLNVYEEDEFLIIVRKS